MSNKENRQINKNLNKQTIKQERKESRNEITSKYEAWSSRKYHLIASAVMSACTKSAKRLSTESETKYTFSPRSNANFYKVRRKTC
jgi:hypothetical protein